MYVVLLVPTSELTAVALQLAPPSVTLDPGESVQFSATMTDPLGQPSSDGTLQWGATGGSITTQGQYTAGVAAGSYQVTATEAASGLSATAGVTIISYGTVATVDVTPTTFGLRLGQEYQLTATLRDAAGNVVSGQAVTWSTGNAAVATVDAAGMVTAQSVGTATITATSGGQSGTATVTVSQVSLGYPNEPVGALPVSTVVPLVHDHSSFVSTYPETDTQPFFAVRNVPEYSFTVTDNTAPFNPTKVGATHLTVSSVTTCGHQAGCAVGKLASTDKLRPPRDGSVKEWYGSFWFKIQPIGGLPAEMNIFGLKFYNFWGQATDGASYATSILNLYPRGVHANDPRNPEHRAPWYMAYYLATSDATPQRIGPYDFRWLKSDATLAGNYAPGGSKYAPQGAIFYESTWYHIETLIDYEIGRFRIFVDGEIYRDALSTDPGMTIPGIPRQPSHFEFSQVWGGARANYASEPAFNPFYLYYDQTYLSYTTSP
jgi:hypothetical protein